MHPLNYKMFAEFLNIIFQSIKLEENKIIVSGGQENMSRAPHSLFYRENKN